MAAILRRRVRLLPTTCLSAINYPRDETTHRRSDVSLWRNFAGRAAAAPRRGGSRRRLSRAARARGAPAARPLPGWLDLVVPRLGRDHLRRRIYRGQAGARG